MLAINNKGLVMIAESELLDRFGTLADLPYNVLNIINSDRGVIIVDTREEADLLLSLKITATHFPGGFQGWQPFYAQFFEGKSVYIIRKNDAALGFNSVQLAKQLSDIAGTLKLFSLPNISAWIDQGGTKKSLGEMISNVPIWEQQPPLPDDEQLSDDGLQWEPPVDIFAKLTPPALKPDLLPEALRGYVQDQAELIGVDPGVLGMACLITCSSAIHDQIQIQPKEHEYGWTESARLWGAIVGDPSVKKSPSIKKASAPLRKIDVDLGAGNATAMQNFNLDEKIYKKSEAAYIKDAISAKEANTQPSTTRPNPAEHPECQRAIIGNATIEAISEILRYNPRGSLCLRDELSGWFGAMDAYSSKGGDKDRPLWLEAYNGGPQPIDRIGRGSFIVPNWSISMIGGIQPDKIRRIAAKTDDDGLLQRFMVVVARDVPEGVDRPPNRAAAERYHNLVRHIFDITPTTQPVLLSPEALVVKRELDAKIREFRSLGEMSLSLMSHLAKWEGLFPRLLLTYHVINCADRGVFPDESVSGDTARQVYELMMGYLFPHAVHFYAEILDNSDHMHHARWIAEFILSRGLEHVTKRDIVASYRALRKQPAWVLKNAMGFLETSGWLLAAKFTNEGATRWDVNPIIHKQFKDMAEREKQRRTEVKRVLKETFNRLKENIL